MSLNLVIDLLEEVKDFEEKNHKRSITVEDFRNFLNEKAYQQENPVRLAGKFDMEVNNCENEIAKQVILLGRYAKQLLRKGLESHEHLANEDFTYLYRLMDYDSLTKTQLIEKNGHEKQSGIEIIKRLTKHELISETPDSEDKRSVRISVTEKGKTVFKNSMQDITRVSKLLCGTLTNEEKLQFLESLKKLNIFHNTIYMNKKEESLEELEMML
ncbi:transcriptional regulator, MarR family [Halpernia humi]|uniref:Transcriptional regulator, MarR family n=1 Tax=Halpernia humi TaxID=493375 RepID=A0A1H6B5S1_9FLAO|nr:MarR family winged helix-turn-helix transcriptional regulator [Halpernia humi]SEG55972.1 transcriptional regulator, MarR family [Halpernia humi]